MLIDGGRQHGWLVDALRRTGAWVVVLAALGGGPWAPPCHAVPYLVTTSDDSNQGEASIPHSLRWAIEKANFYPGADSITFDPAITPTITPHYALPAITDTLTIDATERPIQLVGSNGSGIGLDIQSGATITGLVINGFAYGIKVGSGGSGTIAHCKIGTDPTGTIALGNTSAGVLVAGGYGTIGDSYDTKASTVISGNGNGVGIDVDHGNVYLYGTLVGTDINGTRALPNGVGIRATDSGLEVYSNSYIGNVIRKP